MIQLCWELITKNSWRILIKKRWYFSLLESELETKLNSHILFKLLSNFTYETKMLKEENFSSCAVLKKNSKTLF